MNYFYDLPNELQEKIINHSKEFKQYEDGQIFKLNDYAYDYLIIDRVIKLPTNDYKILGFIRTDRIYKEWRPIQHIATQNKTSIRIRAKEFYYKNRFIERWLYLEPKNLITEPPQELRDGIKSHNESLEDIIKYYKNNNFKKYNKYLHDNKQILRNDYNQNQKCA
jgi:hypothetical protein